MEEYTKIKSALLLIVLLGVSGYGHLYCLVAMYQSKVEILEKEINEIWKVAIQDDVNRIDSSVETDNQMSLFDLEESQGMNLGQSDMDSFDNGVTRKDQGYDDFASFFEQNFISHKRIRRNVGKQIAPQNGMSKIKARYLNDNSSTGDVVQVIKALHKDVKQLKKPAQNKAIHLYSYVDEEMLSRQKPEDQIGSFDGSGFTIKANIFNVWRQSEWSDGGTFALDTSSGIVQVKKTAIYIIYAYLTMHGGSLRKSVGIYVSNKLKPVVEHIALDRTRARRNTKDQVGSKHFQRHRAVYHRASLFCVVHIKKGDTVFIKSTDKTRNIIIKPHLSYWGIAEISGGETTSRRKGRGRS